MQASSFGFVELEVGLDKAIVIQPGEKEIVFPFGEEIEKKFKVKVRPNNVESSIRKIGLNNGDSDLKTIEWAILVNQLHETIPAGMQVIDKFDIDNMEFVPESIKVYSTPMDIDGNMPNTGELVDIFEISESSSDGFILTLKNEIKTAHTIIFSAQVKGSNHEAESRTYKNSATMKNGGLETTSQAEQTISYSSSIEKSGEIVGAEYNADKIKWTIIVNKPLDNLTNVKVLDKIEKGLKLVSGSVKIQSFQTYEDGEPVLSAEEIATYTFDNYARELTVPIGDTEGKGYVITFETKITDELKADNKTSIKVSNTARMTATEFGKDSSGTDIEISSKANTITIKKGDMVEKSGKHYPDRTYGQYGYIEWTIDVNRAQVLLGIEDVLTDDLPAGLRLDQSSITIFEQTRGTNGWNLGLDSKSEWNIVFNNGKLSFNPKASTNKAYQIKFKTKVETPGTFKNEIGFGSGIGGNATPPKDESDDIAATNSIVKSTTYNGLDYANKTMEWQIVLKTAKQPIKNLKITDTFINKGLILDGGKDAFTIAMDSGGSQRVSISNELLREKISIIHGEDGRETGFIIDFGEMEIDGDYIIKYKTKFDRTLHSEYGILEGTPSKYINKIDVTWNEKTKDGSGYEKIENNSDAYYSTIEKETFNAAKSGSFVGGNRESKRINWELTLNYLSEKLTDYTLVDKLGEGQELDATTIKVSKITLNSIGNVATKTDVTNQSEIYEITPNNTGFTIKFTDEINEAYLVEYQSKLVGKTLEKYTNEASFKENGIERKVTAEVGFKHSDEFLVKQKPVQKGYILEWTVVLNNSLSHIKNAVILDELSDYQIYDPNSIKITKDTGDKEELIKGTDYIVSIVTDSTTGRQSMKIELAEIDTRYILTYDTMITKFTNDSEEDVKISNSVKLNGDGIGKEDIETEIEVAIDFGEIRSGGGLLPEILKEREIQIKKVDATDKDLVLAGAEFEIRKQGDSTLLGTAISDENGLVSFKVTESATYVIKEVKAPTGYQVSNKEIIVEVDVNKLFVDEDGNEKGFQMVFFGEDFENTKIPPVTPPGPGADPQNPVRPPGPGETPGTPDEEIPENPTPLTPSEEDEEISEESIPTTAIDEEIPEDVIPLANVPKTGVGYQFNTVTDHMVLAILATEEDETVDSSQRSADRKRRKK